MLGVQKVQSTFCDAAAISFSGVCVFRRSMKKAKRVAAARAAVKALSGTAVRPDASRMGTIPFIRCFKGPAPTLARSSVMSSPILGSGSNAVAPATALLATASPSLAPRGLVVYKGAIMGSTAPFIPKGAASCNAFPGSAIIYTLPICNKNEKEQAS